MPITRTTPIVVPQQPLGWLNPSTIGPTIVTMPQMFRGWHVVPSIPQSLTSLHVPTRHWPTFPLINKRYNLNHSHMCEGGFIHNIPTTPQGQVLQVKETKLFNVT
jgi:hypothetical protein